MSKKQFISNFESLHVEFYYKPMTEAFNMHSFQGGVTSVSDIDTADIFNQYVERFEDAWKELAKY